MLLKPIVTRSSLVFMASFLIGCAPASVMVGKGYGDPPPQIVFLGAVDGKENEYLTWDRPWAFGPVPEELRAAGDIGCMSLGLSLRAGGYHPRALNRMGAEIPGGGFFCQFQPYQAAASSPPRVVERDGKLGWDNPGAFGPIPNDRISAGFAECRKQSVNSRPLGFHPGPLDSDGRPMKEGGFLCIE